MFLCCVIVILSGVCNWVFLNIGFFLYVISFLFQFASWDRFPGVSVCLTWNGDFPVIEA